MGKVKKFRQKYHLSIKKSKSLNNLREIDEQKNGNIIKDSLFMTSKKNIFEGINISLDDLDKSLPADFDVRSVVSIKSRKELKDEERHMKKKEKIKLRHERFIRKLDVTQQLLKDSKNKRARKKQKSLCGDMSSLLEALPTLQSLENDRESRKYKRQKAKLKGVQKAKDRLKQQSLDSKIFKQILDDKTFKENPFQVISQYLKQKVAMEI